MGSCCDTTSDDPRRLQLQIVSTAITAGAIVAGWLFPLVGLGAAALPALWLAYAAGGWDATIRAFRALRCGELDVDLLMLLAAAGAAVVGHWIEGAILLFLFSLGNSLETYAFRRTRRSIEALVELRPERAARLRDGAEELVLLEELRPGDVVRVRPGDRVPIDGVVTHGTSSVDESTLTGESVPVTKEVGATTFAGTLNGGGSLDIRMTRAADDTALSRIIRLVEVAQEARAPTQSWIEDLESRYAFGVIVASGLAILVPWLLLGWTFDDAFYRAMTLLVVASPCALVISIPATIVSAVSNGARHGILFKGGAHLDALSEVTTFALDKTGTLTVGRPEVVDIFVTRPVTVGATPTADQASSDAAAEDRLLLLAAAAEARSEHHLAAAIVKAAEARGMTVPEATSFQSTPGHGVEAVVQGATVRVGRGTWVGGEGAPIATGTAPDPGTEAATPVHVVIDGQHAGSFAIRDHARPRAREAIAALTAAGIERTVMLTGDTRATADAVAARVGIAEVHAELKPDEKSRILAELQTRGPVAMVGDGVNDAPALAVADVGIAIGAAGTDVALETADVVVMGEDLASLARAVRLSRRTRAIVRQNLVFSVAVMGVLVIAALMGWIGLTAGVVGHEGSTVLVVFNGLRLLGDRGPAA